MWKRKICFIMALMLLICNCNNYVINAAEDLSESDFSWTIDSGQLIIRGQGEMDNYKEIGEVPWCDNVNEISTCQIELGITSVGSLSLSKCCELTSVELPDGINVIKNNAFQECSKLVSITLPDSLCSIEEAAFKECSSLTEIVIPKSVKTIGRDAFADCDKLTDIFYLGSQAEWKTIDIDEANTVLFDATIHFCDDEQRVAALNMEPSIPVLIDDFYYIYDSDELEWFADLVNGDAVDENGILLPKNVNANAKLMADLDYSGKVFCSIGYIDDAEVRGDQLNAFQGVFNGNGHSISNITQFSHKGYTCGIFGATYNATIGNLYVENVNVTINDGSIRFGVVSGLAFDTTIINCSVEGNVNSTVAYATGMFVGNLAGNSRVDNCRAIGTYVGSANFSGGFIGASGPGPILNSYARVKNPVSGNGVDFIDGYYGTRIESCYTYGKLYSWKVSSGTEKDNYQNVSVNKKYTQNDFSKFDFENTWLMEDDYPELRIFSKMSMDYECSVENGSKRCPVDKSIDFVFMKNLKDISTKDVKVYCDNVLLTDGYKVAVEKNVLSVYPEMAWNPVSSYIIHIDKSAIQFCDATSGVKDIDLSFKTNYLTVSSDSFATVNAEYIDMKYSKKISVSFKEIWENKGIWIDNKDIVPLPGDDINQYVSLFREWAKLYGYGDVVDKMSDSDIVKVLDSEFSGIVELENGAFVKEIETNKTYFQCMQDLVMIQNMKNYLVEEEEKLRDDTSVESLEESISDMNNYYQRYMEYLGQNDDTSYDAFTVCIALLNYSYLYQGQIGNRVIYGEEAIDTIAKTTRLQKAYIAKSQMLGSQINSFTASNSSYSQTLANASNLKSLINEGNEVVAFFDLDRLAQEKRDWGYFDRIVSFESSDWVGEIPSGIAFTGTKLASSTRSDLKKLMTSCGISDREAEAYEQILISAKNLVGTLSDENVALTLPIKSLQVFMDTGLYYLSYIRNEYPSWLFYNIYYLPYAAPDIYKSIWGNDKDYMLELFQAEFTEDECLAEEDPIVKVLMSAFKDGNQGVVFSQNSATTDDQNIYAIIEAAEYLGTIRNTDVNLLAESLVVTVLVEYTNQSDITLDATVACPTSVNIIKDDTQEVILTITNGMDVSSNFGEYGSFCIVGQESDIKLITLNEGYSLEVIAENDGEMSCSFSKKQGQNVIYAVAYDNYTITENEKFCFDEEEGTLCLIENGEKKTLEPTRKIETQKQESKGENSIPTSDNAISSEQEDVYDAGVENTADTSFQNGKEQVLEYAKVDTSNSVEKEALGDEEKKEGEGGASENKVASNVSEKKADTENKRIVWMFVIIGAMLSSLVAFCLFYGKRRKRQQ